MVPTQIGGYGYILPLPRRGGGGVERGGDACIALGGACFAFYSRLVLEPGLMVSEHLFDNSCLVWYDDEVPKHPDGVWASRKDEGDAELTAFAAVTEPTA